MGQKERNAVPFTNESLAVNIAQERIHHYHAQATLYTLQHCLHTPLRVRLARVLHKLAHRLESQSPSFSSLPELKIQFAIMKGFFK